MVRLSMSLLPGAPIHLGQLATGSLCSMARLLCAGELYKILIVLAVGGVASGFRSWWVQSCPAVSCTASKSDGLICMHDSSFSTSKPDKSSECRLFNSAAERVMCNLRQRLFSHLITQEIGFYDRIRTGELMNRLSEVCLFTALMCNICSVLVLARCCHAQHTSSLAALQLSAATAHVCRLGPS